VTELGNAWPTNPAPEGLPAATPTASSRKWSTRASTSEPRPLRRYRSSSLARASGPWGDVGQIRKPFVLEPARAGPGRIRGCPHCRAEQCLGLPAAAMASLSRAGVDNAMTDLDRAVQLNPRLAHAFSYRGLTALGSLSAIRLPANTGRRADLSCALETVWPIAAVHRKRRRGAVCGKECSWVAARGLARSIKPLLAWPALMRLMSTGLWTVLG
jgi:hypothetical protein